MEGEEPTKKIKTEETDALTQIKKFTSIVCDSGEFDKIKQYTPEDATTNPSLILQAVNCPEYKSVLTESLEYGKNNFGSLKETPKSNQRSSSRRNSVKKSASKVEEKEEEVKIPEFDYNTLSQDDQKLLQELIVDKLCVAFGKKILEHVSGVVSSEVDASLSFNKAATLVRAKRIIRLYEEEGIDRERVLIKLAATWEGIEAGKALKKDKIKTNMTLIFGYEQAIACGQAGLHLISPFVGRILDWHKKQNPEKADSYVRENCPGVKSVTQIYNYYKKFGYNTIVMGASFRNIGEIIALSGCDKLTISPALLEQLQNNKEEDIKQILNEESVADMDIPVVNVDENTFRWSQNEDKCMSELLPDGIRRFAADIRKLETIIHEALVASPTIEKKEPIQEE